MSDRQPVTHTNDLNAYLDGALSGAERARVEDRLALEPDLRHVLEQLRATAMLLRRLPELAPHRSFTLGPEFARTAVAPSTSGVLRFLPIARSLSVAAIVVFMVVGGSLFFDINGGADGDAHRTFQQQDEILGAGVTETQSRASDVAEDAPEAAAPASDDGNAVNAESSMTSRGDAASVGDEPMDDLTSLAQSADDDLDEGAGSSADVAQPAGAETTSTVASALNEDRSSWVWSSVFLGGLALALAVFWFVLARVGRQASVGKP